eukprot:1228721-Rhodomonas_salina.2
MCIRDRGGRLSEARAMWEMQPLLELLHLLSEWRAKCARQAPPATLRRQAGVGWRLSKAGAMLVRGREAI